MDNTSEPSPPRRPHRSIEDFFSQAHGEFDFTHTRRNGVNRPPHRSRRGYWLLLTAIAFSKVVDEVEYSTMPLIVSDKNFQDKILQNDMGQASQVFVAVSVGSLLARLVVGYIMDHESPTFGGRLKLYLVGLMLNAFTSVGTALSSSLTFVIIFQAVSGFAGAVTAATASALLIEIYPPEYRGFYASAANYAWSFGSLFQNAMAVFLLSSKDTASRSLVDDTTTDTAYYSLDSWQWFALSDAIPTLIGLILFYVARVPESPRYLATVGRFPEAAKTANQIASAMGGTSEDLQVWELTAEYQRSSAEDDNVRSNRNSCLNQCPSSSSSLAAFRVRAFAIRFVALLVPTFLAVFPGGLESFWYATFLHSVDSTWVIQHTYVIGLASTIMELLTQGVCVFILDGVRRRIFVPSIIMGGALVTIAYARLLNDLGLDLTLSSKEAEKDAHFDNKSSSFSVYSLCTVILLSAILRRFASMALNLWKAEIIPTQARGLTSSSIGLLKDAGYVMRNALSGALVRSNNITLLFSLSVAGKGLSSVWYFLVPFHILPESRGQPIPDRAEDLNTQPHKQYTPIRTDIEFSS